MSSQPTFCSYSINQASTSPHFPLIKCKANHCNISFCEACRPHHMDQEYCPNHSGCSCSYCMNYRICSNFFSVKNASPITSPTLPKQIPISPSALSSSAPSPASLTKLDSASSKKPIRNDNVTVNEIVRIWWIMLSPDFQATTIKAFSGLSKKDLDERVSLQDVYQDIASIFNSDVKFEVLSSNINPNLIQCNREGKFIREKYREARTSFTHNLNRHLGTGSTEDTELDKFESSKKICDKAFGDLLIIYQKFGKPNYVTREIEYISEIGIEENEFDNKSARKKQKVAKIKKDDEIQSIASSSTSLGDSIIKVHEDEVTIRIEKETKEILNNIQLIQGMISSLSDDSPAKDTLKEVIKKKLQDLMDLSNTASKIRKDKMF